MQDWFKKIEPYLKHRHIMMVLVVAVLFIWMMVTSPGPYWPFTILWAAWLVVAYFAYRSAHRDLNPPDDDTTDKADTSYR
jgi:hypothetical protein